MSSAHNLTNSLLLLDRLVFALCSCFHLQDNKCYCRPSDVCLVSGKIQLIENNSLYWNEI
jgi:hypothetical protein